jgi:hypothetical protein
MTHDQDLTHKLYKLLKHSDALWMQRKRKITTASIFAQLNYANFERRGLCHTLQKSDCSFTAQAMSLARRKLPPDLFNEINRSLQLSHTPRTFAVDGSKIHVYPSYLKAGCTSRTNNQTVSRPAVRPLMMLSSLLDVHSKTCYDSQLTRHFNERTSAIEHFHVCKPGDTLIFDRGYYSFALLHAAQSATLRVVFRLKNDAFKAAKAFFFSNRTHEKLLHRQETATIPVYLYKYFIDGKRYVCATNFESTTARVKALYALRWRVETSFRRLKTDLNAESVHSMTPEGFAQELQARILFDTYAMMRTAIPPELTLQGRKHRITYFVSLDSSLRIFHTIQIAVEKNLTYKSVQRILTNTG